MGELRIAIIGGGIAGLASASLLARRGHQVSLFEKRPGPPQSGAGILLQPVALDVLRQLRIFDAVQSHGDRIQHISRRTCGDLSAMELHYEELTPSLHGLGVARERLISTLLDAARSGNVAIHFAADISELRQDAEQVHVSGSGFRPQAPFDAAVICDGATSRLRERQNLPASMRSNAWGVCAAIIASPADIARHTLWQLQCDAEGYFGLLPVGVGQACLFWNVRVSDYERVLKRDFVAWRDRAGACHSLLAAALLHVRSFADFRFSTFIDVRMRQWHIGRIVFIGDAAHATNPQLGMGANLALADAAILATHLQRTDRSQVVTVLRTYQRARERQIRFYERASRAAGLLANPESLPARIGQRLTVGLVNRFTGVRRALLSAICGYSHLGRLTDK